MIRTNVNTWRAAALASIFLLVGCASTTDYFAGGGAEAEYFESIEDMAAASDLVVSATVSDVKVSDYTSQLGAQVAFNAEVVLKVSQTLGRREGFRGPVNGAVAFLSYLGPEQEKDHALAHLRDALSARESWWFLRSVEADGREFFILINTAGFVVPSQDGSYLTAGFYQRSSELARAGRLDEVDSYRPLLQQLTGMRPEDIAPSLRDAAKGPRDAGLTVPPESRPGG